MPLMYFNGAINIWVSTDGGRTFSWSAGFNVGNYAFVVIFLNFFCQEKIKRNHKFPQTQSILYDLYQKLNWLILMSGIRLGLQQRHSQLNGKKVTWAGLKTRKPKFSYLVITKKTMVHISIFYKNQEPIQKIQVNTLGLTQGFEISNKKKCKSFSR